MPTNFLHIVLAKLLLLLLLLHLLQNHCYHCYGYCYYYQCYENYHINVLLIILLQIFNLQVWLNHWYASVLNKWFLTPFRDDIWNRRQVSVGDRGSFPHDPETIGDIPSWHIHSAK